MQKGNDLLIRGVDGVNTFMRGVDKNDLFANSPDNLQIVTAISVEVL